MHALAAMRAHRLLCTRLLLSHHATARRLAHTRHHIPRSVVLERWNDTGVELATIAADATASANDGDGGSSSSSSSSRASHACCTSSTSSSLCSDAVAAAVSHPSSTQTMSTKKSVAGKGMSFASSLLPSAQQADAAAAATASPCSSAAKDANTPLQPQPPPQARTRVLQKLFGGTVADVQWTLCERMDSYLHYSVPATWVVDEQARSNSIAIQCCPPTAVARARQLRTAAATAAAADKSDSRSSSGSSAACEMNTSTRAASVHGISINIFAYTHAVAQPDAHKLLHIFLRRFNASVDNSLHIRAQSKPTTRTSVAAATAVAARSHDDPASALPATQHVSAEQRDDVAVRTATTTGDDDAHNDESDDNSDDDNAQQLCDTLAARTQSAVAEVSFTAAPSHALARGLCRAFFNSNRRFHYVVVVAVPEEEYATSRDLVVHALMSVVESRVEAAAKNT